MIRRDSGNVANPWVLQGDDGNYDNSTVSANQPAVKVIDATGGITTQGSRFTYSQSDKAPLFDAALNDTTITETDTLTFTYVARDPDIGGTATMEAITVPTGATFNASTGVFNWETTYADSGTHTVTIRATDGNANTTDTTSIITVTNNNRVPVWTAVPVDTVKIGQGDEYNFQLEATDADMDALTYSNVANAPAPDSVSVTPAGMLTIIPALAEPEGSIYNITVRVDDSNGGVVDSTFIMEVTKTNTAPVLTRVSAIDTLKIDEGALGEVIYSATDADGDNLTYSTGDTTTTATMVDSVFTWTPGYTDAGTYSFPVTVTDDGAPNKSDTDTLVVVVAPKNAPPVFTSVLPDTTVFLGNTLTWTYVATDLDADPLTYEFDGNSPGDASINATTGEFSWKPATAAAFPVLIKIRVRDASDTARTQAEVVIEVVTVSVSGNVTYNRSSGAIPIADAVVSLMDGAAVVGMDTTDAAGAYSFADVSAGNYTLMTAKTTEWGGSLASDALEVALYEVNPAGPNLPDTLSWTAGWVTTLGAGPSSADALSILNRSVNKTTSYLIDDWQFFDQDVEVLTSNVVKDFQGICAGDARSDYDPNAALAKSISMSSDEVLKVKKNDTFETAISLENAAEVGSFTMHLRYDASKMEVKSVKAAAGGTLVYNVENDILSIAWADLTGKNALNVEDGGAIAMVSFKASETFAKAEEVTLEMLSGNITDRFAKDLNASVKTPTITVGIPDVYSLSQNYPNPFNPSTTIQYDLPENGKVNLAIYNTLGEQIANLVDTRQEAGSYEVRWNASNLATGVYFYRLHVEGVKGFVLTKKMILMK